MAFWTVNKFSYPPGNGLCRSGPVADETFVNSTRWEFGLVDGDAVNQDAFLESIAVDSVIRVYDRNDPSNYGIYVVTSNEHANFIGIEFHQIDGVSVEGNGSSSNGMEVVLEFYTEEGGAKRITNQFFSGFNGSDGINMRSFGGF